jgi:CRP-like cAMP-binding protein
MNNRSKTVAPMSNEHAGHRIPKAGCVPDSQLELRQTVSRFRVIREEPTSEPYLGRTHTMLADTCGLDGPKGELLSLLEKLSRKMGLAGTVIRTLVEHSEITYPGRRLPLLSGAESSQLVRFVIQGVAKVVCDVPPFGQVIEDFVGKGEFLCLPPAPCSDMVRRVDAVVHEGPVVLALMPRELLATAIGQLPPRNAALLVSWSWRAPSRLALAKTALMPLPTGERLICELVRLARRFGRPQDDGWTLIQVPLRQEDLASLIVRSRANVSRAFARLRKSGLVDRVGHRIRIATSALAVGDRPFGGGRASGVFGLKH